MRFDQQAFADELAGVVIEVKGLDATLAAMRGYADATEDMRDLMHSTGEIVASAARMFAPARSGALKGSIRAGRGKTKAVIRAGSARSVPYAAIVHYPYRRPFMVQALAATGDQALAHITKGLAELQRKHGL